MPEIVARRKNKADSSEVGGAGLPETLYRTHVIDCDLPENAYTFDFMSDYLTMMAILERSFINQLHESCQLTLLQYRILVKLSEQSPVKTSNLSKVLTAGLSTISMAVAKLADEGLVSRHESATDMRTVNLKLTRRGQHALTGADKAIARTIKDYWSKLTSEQLQAALTSSTAAVERHSEPRIENGRQRLDTALVDTVIISRSLTGSALQSQSLAINDFRVLLALRIQGGSSTATEIASFLFLNTSDITQCLKHLEEKGLITRQRSDRNRRMRIIELTEAGRSHVIELMPIVFDALHETCHSDDELIRIHISAARDLVARKRHQSMF